MRIGRIETIIGLVVSVRLFRNPTMTTDLVVLVMLLLVLFLRICVIHQVEKSLVFSFFFSLFRTLVFLFYMFERKKKYQILHGAGLTRVHR